MGSGEARHGLADSAFMRGLSFFFSPPPASCQKASSRLSAANSSGPGAGSRARVARRGAGGGRGGARGGRGAARGAGGAGGAGDAGGRRRRRRRRRWLSRRWRRRRSDGAPARPSSSSPPRRRSGAWTSTPSPASPSMCCARRPPAATISLKFILRRLNTSQGTDYHLHFKPCCMAPLTQWSVKHVWSESEDCLPFLQLAQDYISSCGKKTLHEILEKVFKSFRPLLGLPDVDDDAFEEYNADVEEEEPEADHQQMGVSQQ
uniref:Maturin n=190 Tax=Aves TaxID=8782 RepID=A0A8U7M1C2_CORMO